MAAMLQAYRCSFLKTLVNPEKPCFRNPPLVMQCSARFSRSDLDGGLHEGGAVHLRGEAWRVTGSRRTCADHGDAGCGFRRVGCQHTR